MPTPVTGAGVFAAVARPVVGRIAAKKGLSGMPRQTAAKRRFPYAVAAVPRILTARTHKRHQVGIAIGVARPRETAPAEGTVDLRPPPCLGRRKLVAGQTVGPVLAAPGTVT